MTLSTITIITRQSMGNIFLRRQLLTGKRAHRDWRLWVGLFFMFAAITIYAMTVDLSLVPHIHTQPRPSVNTGLP